MTDILSALDAIQARAEYDPVCHCGIPLSTHSVYDNHSFTEMASIEAAGVGAHARTDIPRLCAALRVAVEFITGDRKCHCEDCRDIIAAQIQKALEGR